jgi:short-subunit dehydrogenase
MTMTTRAKSEKHLALITGASSGIGLAFAERLAREGYDLIVVARRKERLDELAQLLRGAQHVEVEVLAADLTKPAGLHRVEERAAHAGLTLLVNNAGFGYTGAFADLDVDGEEEEIRLNVIALVRLTHAVLPGMIKRQRGSIINVSSMAGFQPGPYMATYGATKAYVTSFTEALGEELRGSGVYVQALCPGFTRTEFQERGHIDTSMLPEMAWMTADGVVAASLAAMKRQQLICVPGLGNQIVSTATGFVPRAITRRLLAASLRRAVR